ncbi:bacteriocin [Chryseobacterium sp. NRRL B-14859]|uniref:bacteriocin n=1 Tax=unclassified Chryseobacterium TaxID=2593645 RepID=UPI000F457F18|nr:bacteriocin [Chryseobacterium sp. G0240]ROI06932.1 bacteriocin [Chryseobacterium sp. G0240]
MKHQHLDKGKKLNKKELRAITGGLRRCIDPATGLCIAVGAGCAEPQCKFVLDPVLP